MVYQIVTNTYLDCILLIFRRDRNYNGLSWGQPEWPVIQTKITFYFFESRQSIQNGLNYDTDDLMATKVN